MNNDTIIGKCCICGREVTVDESYSNQFKDGTITCVWCARNEAELIGIEEYEYVTRYIQGIDSNVYEKLWFAFTVYSSDIKSDNLRYGSTVSTREYVLKLVEDIYGLPSRYEAEKVPVNIYIQLEYIHTVIYNIDILYNNSNEEKGV